MTTAADIVQALAARTTRPPLERRTGMPYGWALWLRNLPPLPARPHAAPDELAGLLAQRPARPRSRGEELATWPAFFSLFRAGWLPAPRDERPLRVVSGTGSVVLHLLFLVFLAWVAWMQSLYLPLPPEEDAGGERIEVGFVGAGDPGTPQVDADAGPGGMPGDLSPAPAAAAAERAASAAEEVQAQPRPILPVHGEIVAASVPPPPLPEVAVREVPEPTPEPTVQLAEQPAQVTEVEVPDIEYVLPPTTPRTVDIRIPVEPQLREREVDVVVIEAPQVTLAQPRPVDVQVRQPRAAELELRTREIDEPLPQVQVQPMTVRAPEIEARLPGTPEIGVRQREVAMPTGTAASAATTTTPSDTAGSSSAAVAATGSSTANADGQARTPGQAATPASAGGSTASSQPATGDGWRSPVAGDDWGQARSGEQRPGGATGLFDAQGRVRLPGEGEGSGSSPAAGAGPGQGGSGEGLAGRGAPGGDSDHWSRERFEKSGTWLKRPPYDYEPTSFDRYWVPNDSLLAEWVRKGMKTVAIPIPGTGKKINCVISLLQVGGGCGIVDPDLNEQPAEGRASPDIPFKPELQEDNGSVRPVP